VKVLLEGKQLDFELEFTLDLWVIISWCAGYYIHYLENLFVLLAHKDDVDMFK